MAAAAAAAVSASSFPGPRGAAGRGPGKPPLTTPGISLHRAALSSLSVKALQAIFTLESGGPHTAPRRSPRAAAGDRGETAAPSGTAFPALASSPLLSLVDPETGAPAPLPSSSGVYAIHDQDGKLQYMGIGRRLNASLAVHVRELPELCASVKLLEVASPERAALVAAWQQWMEEHIQAHGAPPPGNESGNTLWTTRRSRPSKPEILLTPGNNKTLTCSITELVDKVVKDFKVVAFVKGTRTAPQCGFSHRVLTLLNESGADYEVLNVLDEDHNPGLRDAIKEYTQWPTIPQIFIGGEFIGGADILQEMAESGELKELLARAQNPIKASA